jgi:hypothetical protein
MTSILTNQVQKVHKIMKEELWKYVGEEPRLKIERYREEKGEEEGVREKEKEERIWKGNTMIKPVYMTEYV